MPLQTLVSVLTAKGTGGTDDSPHAAGIYDQPAKVGGVRGGLTVGTGLDSDDCIQG